MRLAHPVNQSEQPDDTIVFHVRAKVNRMRASLFRLQVALAMTTLAAGTVGARAADLPARPSPQPAVVLSDPSAWHVTVTLYGWATAINGDVGLARLPSANVDTKFSDILSNLKGAFMGALTARNDTFLLGGDLIWSKVGQNVSFKIGDGPLADRRGGAVARFNQTTMIGTAFAGYRIPIGTPDLALYATAGVRYQHLSAKIQTYRADPRFDRASSANVGWVDPVVGLAANYRINDKWYVDALADIGGFGVGSDLTAQGMVSVGYRWTETVSTAIGYRALYTDYKKDNGRDGSFRYDTTLHGPLAMLSFSF
jgi:hypothetical protein